jgi:hypothetical protein
MNREIKEYVNSLNGINISEADNDEWSETYMMIIENNGDGVRLVSEKTNQIFTQKTKHIDNPMTKYK